MSYGGYGSSRYENDDHDDSKKKKKKRSGFVGGITFAVILAIIVIIGALCTTKIEAGYAGVVYNMNGGIQGETLDQGWHLKRISQKVTSYTVGIEQSYLTATRDGDSKDDDSFEVPTSDAKGLTVELTYTYRFDKDRVADVFTRFRGISGEAVRDTFIKPNIISWTKEVTARYPVTEILGDKRASLNLELSEYLADKFEPYGIIIESASLINIEADPETKAAVQKKVNAQQELELAEVEAKTAKINAEKEKEVAIVEAEKNKETAAINAEQAKIKANADAEVKKIQAQGEADALRIAAEAEAEANAKVAASLTSQLIEQQKIEKWDGSVPYIQGSGVNPIIDMTKSTSGE